MKVLSRRQSFTTFVIVSTRVCKMLIKINHHQEDISKRKVVLISSQKSHCHKLLRISVNICSEKSQHSMEDET